MSKFVKKEKRFFVKSFDRCLKDYHGYIANEIKILRDRLPSYTILDNNDLWQEARLILFKVWMKFDPSRNVQFQTLLVRYLKRYFTNILASHFRSCRTPGVQIVEFDWENLVDENATQIIFDEDLRRLQLRYNKKRRKFVKVSDRKWAA